MTPTPPTPLGPISCPALGLVLALCCLVGMAAPAKPPAPGGDARGGGSGGEARAPRGIMLPYQQRFEADPAPIKIWRKGRRIGADYSRAYYHTKRRVTGETITDLTYTSRAEKTAREFIRYCARWAKLLGVISEAVWETEEINGIVCRVGEIQFPEIVVDGGGTHAPIIRAVSGHDDAFRGFDGDWILSEFAFYQNPWAVMDAAAGISLLGGRGEILTTVNMEGDEFEQLCDEARRVGTGNPKPTDRPGLSLHVTTFADAAHDGLTDAINRDRGSDFTPEELIARGEGLYRTKAIRDREMYCKPGRDEGSFFPWHELQACINHDLPAPVTLARDATQEAKPFDAEWHERGMLAVDRMLASVAHAGSGASALFMGMDVGRTKDKFVIAVVGRFGSATASDGVEYRIVGMLVWQRMIFSTMQEAADRVMSRAGVLRGCGDAQGIGMQICEFLERKHTARFEGIPSTNATMEDMATRGSSHTQSGTLRLPNDDDVLGAFNRIRESRTPTGKRRYDVARNTRGADIASGDADAGGEGHSDEFWATMEALLAAGSGGPQYREVEAEWGVM